MKLLHMGDLHLGKSLGDFELIEDQKYLLEEVLQIAQEKEVDGILLAGDIYDKAIPSEAAVRLLDSFLSELAKKKVKVFLISGNHDSDERLSFGSTLFEGSDIYIASKFEGNLCRKTLSDEYGEVAIYMLPFVKASQVRHFYEDEIGSYEDAVRVILEHAEIDWSKRNVLVAHQFVAGNASDPQLAGSEGMGTINVGLVEKIGYDCLDGFDYVALGHIHSPQKVGKESIRYSGSPLKYSLSEIKNEKSIPLIHLGKKGEVDVELIPLSPMRDLRHIKGTMEQLLQPDRIENPQDFMYVTLTEEEVVNDAMGIVQQYYPNTVKIDYDNSHTKQLEQYDLSGISLERPFAELIKDFYEKMYGTGMSEDEMEIMESVAREAGVLHEAD